MEKWIALVIWLMSALYSYGTALAYFTRKYYGDREDYAFAILFSMLGPFSAFLAFFMSDFNHYGWTLKIDSDFGHTFGKSKKHAYKKDVTHD